MYSAADSMVPYKFYNIIATMESEQYTDMEKIEMDIIELRPDKRLALNAMLLPRS